MPEPVSDLSSIVKAYDIRGIVPDQLDETKARALGAAFVQTVGAKRVVIGYDMRPSSPGMSAAFAEGITSQGADVVDIGLASTDQLYYASGSLDCAGAMFTASHNPAQYNGIKLCRAGAAPVGQDSGLREIRERAEAILREGRLPAYDGPSGTATRQDVLADYAAFLLSLVDLRSARPLRVVIDAGSGMAGHTVPAVFGTLPFEVVPLYFELDGTFPYHEANPIDPENLRDLQTRVKETSADIGLAFDGDADRCFLVDERGEIVSPSVLTALIAVRELGKHPGASIIHNLITSRAVAEIVTEHGGTPIRTKVGHSFIKAAMAETGAVFGGEHSGHFYFASFWRADSGMLAALHALAALAETPVGKRLSELLSEYSRYCASGEINSVVEDAPAAVARVREAFEGRDGATVDELDGLTVSARTWWFNLRASNTEPLLRLNAEAEDPATMAAIRDEVLGLIGGHVPAGVAATVLEPDGDTPAESTTTPAAEDAAVESGEAPAGEVAEAGAPDEDVSPDEAVEDVAPAEQTDGGDQSAQPANPA